MLVESILKGIGNEVVISEGAFIPTPLRLLIVHYNKLAINDNNLPAITEKTTGAELKAAIRMLNPRDQIALLHEYCDETKDLSAPLKYAEDPREADERKLRNFTLKVVVIVLGFIACALIGAVVTVGAMTGMVSDSSVIKPLLATATEIIKFILSTGK